jgi:hypothetical protein
MDTKLSRRRTLEERRVKTSTRLVTVWIQMWTHPLDMVDTGEKVIVDSEWLEMLEERI